MKAIKLTGKMVAIDINDNFDDYDGSDEETKEFHRQVNDGSVVKTCRMCHEEVRLLPHYDKCNHCMNKLENGGEW